MNSCSTPARPQPKASLAIPLYASSVLASALGAAVIACAAPSDPCRDAGVDFFSASSKPSALPSFCDPDRPER